MVNKIRNSSTPLHSVPKQKTFSKKILLWYDTHQRSLPWRIPSSEKQNPYHVWLSEIMLQQTTVPTVVSYFTKFIDRWPTVHDLASASLDEVLHAWQGLGYYARARNMHKCASIVSEQKNGLFPSTEEELVKLPGIGPYTAAAISAIAFGQPSTVVDGNIDRIISRLFCIKAPIQSAKKEIYEYAKRLTPKTRAGDYAQALMDLGSGICKPKSPKCLECPVSRDCLAKEKGETGKYPLQPIKETKPKRTGTVFWIERASDKAVFFIKRPTKGLLGGLYFLPSTNWDNSKEVSDPHFKHAIGHFQPLGKVSHTFTHFHLELEILSGKVSRNLEKKLNGEWILRNQLDEYAFPTLMRKIFKKEKAVREPLL